MKVETVSIEWAEGTVTGRLIRGDRQPGVVLAHGAGVDQNHAMLVALRDGIAAAGFPVLTFNYAYTERGSKRPDRPDKLLAVHRSVIEWFRGAVTDRIVLMGRSMGGRMATHLAAEGAEIEAVILHAYPLHPAGKPEKLRVDHLPSITVPLLFLVGERDPLSRMDLFDTWIRPLPTAEVFVVADGDHSLRVRKMSGRTNEEAFDEVMNTVSDWLSKR